MKLYSMSANDELNNFCEEGILAEFKFLTDTYFESLRTCGDRYDRICLRDEIEIVEQQYRKLHQLQRQFERELL